MLACQLGMPARWAPSRALAGSDTCRRRVTPNTAHVTKAIECCDDVCVCVALCGMAAGVGVCPCANPCQPACVAECLVLTECLRTAAAARRFVCCALLVAP